MKIPTKWRDVINFRICKRSFEVYLGRAFLEIAPLYLSGDQTLYVAGTDKNLCWYTTKSGLEQVAVGLTSNSEEADMRVWLHASYGDGIRKLIFSPDTDVYHIALMHAQLDNEVMVQLNPLGTDFKLVDMKILNECLCADSELHATHGPQISKVIVMLYISTGRDFTSFFVGLSKVTFLRHF